AAMAAERGTTVFFSSHLVDEVQSIATCVGIVQAGRMRAEGRVDELRRRVRRLRGAADLGRQSGFRRVREDVWEAEAALWEQVAQLDGALVAPLSLHEIFLAYARTDSAQSA